MTQPDFKALRRRLLEGGVAPRRVRRIVQELQAHCEDLTSEYRDRGLESLAARDAAVERVGPQASLAEQILARRELLTWSRRWPWAVYGIGPLVVLGAGFVAGIAATAAAGAILHELLHARPHTLLALLQPFRLYVLYGLPVLVAALMAALAVRRHVALGWALAALALAALLGSLTNMSVSLHSIGAGIGWSFRPSVLEHVLLGRWLPTSAAAAALAGGWLYLRRPEATRPIKD